VQFNEVYTGTQGREAIVEANTPMVIERCSNANAVSDFDLIRSIVFEGNTQRIYGITGMKFTIYTDRQDRFDL